MPSTTPPPAPGAAVATAATGVVASPVATAVTTSPAGAAAAGAADAAVRRVLAAYFDGLHHGDTAVLAGVFHPEAVYATASEGTLLRLTMPEYFPVVAAREPPAARREARRDLVVSVEFAGPVTALARVECSMGPRRYTDFLTLLLLDGRWQVIAKVFHFETRPAEGE
ncbi:nuclear transport factor 2 family protein [Streptomyces sp. NPDC093225]|uniref:nuclear transport factor 2 family protein n=1 Tax=Streptomyces sp. NPDC093225 TaxID=3366034 RepID=UPI0038239F80